MNITELNHWSQLIEYFGLQRQDNLEDTRELQESTLRSFLLSNEDNESVTIDLKSFLLSLADKTEKVTFEANIYRAIANCGDNGTMVKWFVVNMGTFYN